MFTASLYINVFMITVLCHGVKRRKRSSKSRFHVNVMKYLKSKVYIVIYHINCGVIQGFPVLRKAVITRVKKISYFFTCVDIANQLLTRHSPLAPLGQVDE